MLDAAVTESIAAIEEDGAEVIVLGCSAAYWMQPLLQKKLAGDRLGRAGARRLSLRHRRRQDAGRSRCRCERPRLSRRAAGEVAAQEGVLAMTLTRRCFMAATGIAASGSGTRRRLSLRDHQGRRAARARRRHRQSHPPAAAGAGEEARRVDPRRQPARRGGDASAPLDRRQGQARRLHLPAGRQRALPEPGDPRFAAVRHAEGLHRRHHGGAGAGDPDRPSRRAGAQPARS